MDIIENKTNKDVYYQNEKGDTVVVFGRELNDNKIPKVITKRLQAFNIVSKDKSFLVTARKVLEIKNKPMQKNNVFYIVTSRVAEASHRSDFIVANVIKGDKATNTIYCKEFISMYYY